MRCPLCRQTIRRPFLRDRSAFPLIEIHRYRGTHETCRLLLRANGDQPTVTAIPEWESDEQALERAWRERR